MGKKSIYVLLSIMFLACNEQQSPKNIHRAFYYWKSNYALSAFEKGKLDSLQVQTIYIKYFDVAWDPLKTQVLPIAKINFTDTASLKGKAIIPTVFITNESLQKSDSSAILVLAEKIVYLVNAIHEESRLKNFAELQIDCDWTATTKDKYFSLLGEIKSLIKGIKLSATIRMHQVKYRKSTGVPPVDKGLLMCYNMGDLKKPETKNSILDPAEFEKYTTGLNSYPLQLDIALPLFNWCVLFRNGVFKGLVQSISDAQLTSAIFIKENNFYTFKKDTVLNGLTYIKGDVLRKEESHIADIARISKIIQRELKNTDVQVSFYHIDSVILSKYSTYELEILYNSFY